MAAADRAPDRITRADIEAKVAQIEQVLQGDVDKAKTPVLFTGVMMSVLVVLIAYFFGKRAGNKRSAVVEVRRY
jgi:uncharacterized membrane protein YvbJ